MAATKKSKKSTSHAKKDSRCWAGDEPTPGKKPGRDQGQLQAQGLKGGGWAFRLGAPSPII